MTNEVVAFGLSAAPSSPAAGLFGEATLTHALTTAEGSDARFAVLDLRGIRSLTPRPRCTAC